MRAKITELEQALISQVLLSLLMAFVDSSLDEIKARSIQTLANKVSIELP